MFVITIVLIILISQAQMNISIGCNYARTGVRTLYQRMAKPFQRISHSDLTGVINSYNKQYEGQNMHLVPSVGYKRIPELLVSFNKKWHPQSQKKLFLQVFSILEWKSIPLEEKQNIRLVIVQNVGPSTSHFPEHSLLDTARHSLRMKTMVYPSPNTTFLVLGDLVRKF